jgi:hypothetical protein
MPSLLLNPLLFDCSWVGQGPGEQVLPFTGIIWQYASEALKARTPFDPAVLSGTDPKETANDICRDLIISVFTKTLLMAVKSESNLNA